MFSHKSELSSIIENLLNEKFYGNNEAESLAYSSASVRTLL